MKNSEGKAQLIYTTCALPGIALSTALSLAVSIICISFGYSIIFQNIYYIPIILTCVYFTKQGILFTTIISVVYVALMVLIPQNTSYLIPALIRVVFFEAVAGVIVWLATLRSEAEKKLKLQRDDLANIVKAQTEKLNQDLEHSLRLERAYQDTVEYYDEFFLQQQTAVAIWNQDWCITRVNPAFTLLAGLSASELEGRKINSIPGFEWTKIPGENFKTTITDFHTTEGKTRKLLWNISQIRNKSQGGQIRMMAIGLMLQEEETHE